MICRSVSSTRSIILAGLPARGYPSAGAGQRSFRNRVKRRSPRCGKQLGWGYANGIAVDWRIISGEKAYRSASARKRLLLVVDDVGEAIVRASWSLEDLPARRVAIQPVR